MSVPCLKSNAWIVSLKKKRTKQGFWDAPWDSLRVIQFQKRFELVESATAGILHFLGSSKGEVQQDLGP